MARYPENAAEFCSTIIDDGRNSGLQLWKDLKNIRCILGNEDQPNMRKTIEINPRSVTFKKLANLRKMFLVNSYARGLAKKRKWMDTLEEDCKIKEIERVKIKGYEPKMIKSS